MLRRPNPRPLTAAFLLLSAAVSVAILAARNPFDDEIFSLYLVTGRVHDILAITSQGDVHPPGMYLLAHFAHAVLPSFRWMNLFPLVVLYTGLAVFLFRVTPLFPRIGSRLCLLLLATLHPQLLLWGATFRWYGWWTGLALITMTIACQPSALRPVLTTARASAIALLLAGLFYLNYITLLFAAPLAGVIVLRYKSQPRKQLVLRGLLSAGIFLLLITPQLHIMLTVHIPDGRAQRYGLAASVLRLLQSLFTSEAYLPWHPLAIAAALVFIGLGVAGIGAARSILRQPHPATKAVSPISALAAITLFEVLFFLLVALSGLGGKPRNGLLLVPLLAVPIALIVQTLRPRLAAAVLLFFALWSAIGIAHLIGRYGLTKASMIDRPEQVVSLVEKKASPSSALACSVVVTYDAGLAFAFSQANLPRVLVITPFRGEPLPRALTLPPEDCPHPHLYVVESYLGGSIRRVDALNAELAIARQYIDNPAQLVSLSLDPDAPMKRRLARIPGLSADLDSLDRIPDFRYVVTSGLTDRSGIEAMRQQMPLFVSGEPVVD